MKLFLQQENRSLSSPFYYLSDSRGDTLFTAKSKGINFIKKIDIADKKGSKIASISKIPSIVPKYKIVIENTEPFVISRKISISHIYKITGSPISVHCKTFDDCLVTLDGIELASAEMRSDNIACSKYEIDVTNNQYLAECLCVVLAIDSANKAICRAL